MFIGRTSRSSFVGGALFGLLTVVAASYAAQVEAEPGDRIGRLPFLVAPPAIAGSFGAQIAMGVDGRFLVVWPDAAPSQETTDLLARRFNAAGEPSSAEEQIVSGVVDGWYHGDARVALAADGTFVVVWHALDRPPRDSEEDEQVPVPNEIQGQRFNADGVPLGERFIVSERYPDERGGGLGLAMAADGHFAVVWGRAGGDGFPHASYVRLYDANGQARGAPILVTDASYLPEVAMTATGNFTVTWLERPSPPASDTVRLRRFDASGAPLGAVVTVATSNANGDPRLFHVAMSPAGQLVVAYLRGFSHVYVRRFDAAGQSLGGEVRVTTSTGVGADPEFRIAMNAAGDFVLAWTEDELAPFANETMLHTRLYSASGTPVTVNERHSFRELSRESAVGAVGFGPDNFVVGFQLLNPGESRLYGQLFAGVRDTRPSCARFIATKNGTAGADTLHGSAAHDIIHAGGGNDTVHGWGGLDVICGAHGADVLYGGSGNDQLVGGPGDDLLDGGTGNGDYCNGEGQTNADTAVSCEVTRNIP